MSKWVTVMSAGNGGKLILDIERISMIDTGNSCVYIDGLQVEMADFELNEVMQVLGFGGDMSDNLYGNTYYNT